jgi:hypothetical protein
VREGGRAENDLFYQHRGDRNVPIEDVAGAVFTSERSANVQTILSAENAFGYKLAERHHGKTGLRDMRKGDVADETTCENTMK